MADQQLALGMTSSVHSVCDPPTPADKNLVLFPVVQGSQTMV